MHDNCSLWKYIHVYVHVQVPVICTCTSTCYMYMLYVHVQVHVYQGFIQDFEFGGGGGTPKFGIDVEGVL